MREIRYGLKALRLQESAEPEWAASEPEVEAKPSFPEVFKTYYPRIYYLFLSWGLAPSEAEDQTQEAFLQVYRGYNQLREPASLGFWIRRIAFNTFLAHHRRRRSQMRDAEEVSLQTAQPEGSLGLEESIPANPGSPLSVLEDLIEVEQKANLRRAIKQLPPQMQRCAILRYKYGLKMKEIAALLGISVPAVTSQVTQARRRLEQALRRPDWIRSETDP